MISWWTVIGLFIVSLVIAWVSYTGRIQKGLPNDKFGILVAQIYLIYFIIALARYCCIRV